MECHTPHEARHLGEAEPQEVSATMIVAVGAGGNGGKRVEEEWQMGLCAGMWGAETGKSGKNVLFPLD